MKGNRKGAATIFAATCLALVSANTWASGIPVPFASAPGVEFSDNIDRKANGSISNGQSIVFAADHSTQDGYMYPGGLQVDAMSSKFDPYYHGIFTGQSAMLLGTAGDTTWDNGVKHSVMSVTPDGVVRGWARPADFFLTGANDLDCLEVGGTSGSPNSELYSIDGDFGGVSIWDFNSGSPVAWMMQAELDAALGLTNSGYHADLDAMIVNGDDMIFSINNLAGYYDGGELFVYRRGSGTAATFLQFGGQTWNTVFDSGFFLGCKGHISELDIISAVNVVPEPGTIAALSVGALSLLRRRKK